MALLFERSSTFGVNLEESQEDFSKSGLIKLFEKLIAFKNFLFQLSLGAILVASMNLIFPFLTQALVDHGIQNKDIDFIYIILIAQLVLFFSRGITEFIRGWILAHMGTRINISILSDFLDKLTKLPLSFFSQRNLGDIIQRMSDNDRIEMFLTHQSSQFIFSVVNLCVFSTVLIIYNTSIFAVFFIGSILAILWVLIFLNQRKINESLLFKSLKDNHNAVIQFVNGMSEIKLNQSERRQRWLWGNIQSRLFDVKLKSLAISQYQNGGMQLINESKNIIIIIMASIAVVEGKMTLGMMMAVVYILGQLNAPIEQFVIFIQQAQNAKISIERLGEISELPNEVQSNENDINFIPAGDIEFRNVAFKYSEYESKNIIEGLNFTIPEGKTTAIVGTSGSGKTTVIRLLLKFFSCSEGTIKVGGMDIKMLCPNLWREHCGTVMQDGYSFSDSVARNIAMGSGSIDMQRVIHSAKAANIHDEIEKMPKGYRTKLGAEGYQMSGGQRQRIFIARAIYKNPKFILLDEATSALDSKNEKSIQENFKYFFKKKTVLIVAHRLSTVKGADQIIVLEKGRIVEVGNHDTLTKKKGYYFNLVKNQLELGS